MKRLFMIVLRVGNNRNFFTILILSLCFTLIEPHAIFAQTPDTLWFEDWEGDWTENWHVSAGTWEVGIPTSGPGGAYNGQNCAATVLTGNYFEPVDSRLIRHTSFVVPPASENPRLRFWHWYSFSYYDYGEVQISMDNGVTWENVSVSYTWTGSNVWTYPLIDLSAFAGQSIIIAFHFHSQDNSGGGNVSAGWYIDDVALLKGDIVFSNPEGFEFGIGDWAAERGTWEVGEPTSGPGSAYAGQNCAATHLSGNYAEPVDSRLISPLFRVPLDNPALQFWHWFSFSYYDYGEVQIKVGDDQWQPISQAHFGGTSSGVWTFYYLPLSIYADSLVQLAFYFHSQDNSGGGNVSSGWYVDSLEILGGPNSLGDLSTASNITRFELHRNYPNPFNPTTTIRYNMPKAAQVKLTVFNTLGQQVVQLVNERKAAGAHEVTFDGQGLSSGVYFYRIEAEEFHDAKRMLLIR